MAQAFFYRLARERGVDAVAESARTAPGKRVNPAAARAMAEAGLSLEGHRPRPLTPSLARRADRIIWSRTPVAGRIAP